MDQEYGIQLPGGAVTAEEIHNVFTEALRLFDEEVWPANDPFPPRTLAIAHLESIRFELFKRCRSKSERADRNPVVIKANEKAEAERIAAMSKNREQWRERTRMGRDYAKSQELK